MKQTMFSTRTRPPSLRCLFVLLTLLAAALQASAAPNDEFDNARWKLQANLWISFPTGYFNGKDNEGYFDLQRDFGFGDYATFSGKLDWRFKRKHHLLFTATPVVASHTVTLTRTVIWQDQTFDLGARVDSRIASLIFSPGYEYDFFRKRQGALGFLAILNLAHVDARLKLAAGASGGGGSGSGSVSADGSRFAPLPAIGPTFRWYPIPDSSRFYLDGSLTGMSFFGYGNFVSANAVLGFPIAKKWDVRVGYLMGSRLRINSSDNEIAIRLTQKGPIVGVERHWGTR